MWPQADMEAQNLSSLTSSTLGRQSLLTTTKQEGGADFNLKLDVIDCFYLY
jgi:hypothetical protein